MMNVNRPVWKSAAMGCAGALGMTLAVFAEPSDSGKESASDAVANEHRVSIDVARDRAKVMHDVYSSTLDVMHHRYFHGERAVVPARALEDVFSDLKEQTKMEARWISVNMNAMSVDHEPKTEFEKRAAREIANGEKSVEVVEDGYYRRAGAIPLTGGCVSCHGGFFKPPSKTPKFAGLIISVPLKEEAAKVKEDAAKK